MSALLLFGFARVTDVSLWHSVVPRSDDMKIVYRSIARVWGARVWGLLLRNRVAWGIRNALDSRVVEIRLVGALAGHVIQGPRFFARECRGAGFEPPCASRSRAS